MIQWKTVTWQNRAHFFAVAAKMMRRILVTEAIRRGPEKRGGSAVLVSLSEADSAAEKHGADILGLHEALTKLASFDERKSQLVELRFFAGLSVEETAEVLGISLRTVHREWNLARAWLYRQLRGDAR